MLEALVKVVYGITAEVYLLFKFKAVLKLIVDFSTLLTGVEGVRSSKMHSHFLRAVFMDLQCPAGEASQRETPQAYNAEEAL
ncbi:hypothetical protein CYOC110262_26215 [Cytobacillus oceanisediminis]|uniref:Uncharacterized protein n=2 Tax=Cytobacillus oceanisediminis TaxID=665099 RepID=A0A562J3U9_9BACI|nr:hypothetical protein IQ19_05514 [Cytobacillus oceanisediminis]